MGSFVAMLSAVLGMTLQDEDPNPPGPKVVQLRNATYYRANPPRDPITRKPLYGEKVTGLGGPLKRRIYAQVRLANKENVFIFFRAIIDVPARRPDIDCDLREYGDAFAPSAHMGLHSNAHPGTANIRMGARCRTPHSWRAGRDYARGFRIHQDLGGCSRRRGGAVQPV